MEWFTQYSDDLKQAVANAESILLRFPPAFSKPAVHYLHRFQVLNAERTNNYICYLLPYWLIDAVDEFDRVRLKPIIQDFTIANLLGMMHYHLIDQAMDKPDSNAVHRLPLANLIYQEFTAIYSRYFQQDSLFWNYFRKYLLEWADAVTHENSRNYFHEQQEAIAHKAAPVKLCIAGVMLLTGKDQLIPLLEDAADKVLITLQLLDDWDDWEKDLNEGSYNCLIALVQTRYQIPDNRKPTAEEVEQALYVDDILKEFSVLADCNRNHIEAIRPISPQLYNFHEFLRLNLENGYISLQNHRNKLYGGGLDYLLSNIIENT